MTRFSTGNEFVAIPDILTHNAGILDISFLYTLYRSVIELNGTEEEPFLQPVVRRGEFPVSFAKAQWRQDQHWIPSLTLQDDGLRVHYRVFAPLAHRGFACIIEVASESDQPVDLEIGWKGLWKETNHVVKLPKGMRGERFGSISPTNGGSPLVEFKGAAPLFAVAFCPSEPMQVSVSSDGEPGRVVTVPSQGEVIAGGDDGIRYLLTLPVTLQPGEQKVLALYVGLGLEQISATASSVDLDRHGWENLYADLATWLEHHILAVEDEKLGRVLNLNSFYNYFFSQAVTLDTEQLVLVTSRSSGYHVSAAYWDRDAMLWSLPAVLQIDPGQARKMIEHAFTTQLKNVGVHSRFIDGVVLEPGFALDELCSPIRALSLYVRMTRDMSIVFDRRVQTGVNRISQILASRKHPTAALFDTMLTPSDELALYPYLAYDNVLAWRALRDLSWMYELIHDLDRSDDNKQQADLVRQSIMEHFIVEGPLGPMFAWSIDLQGNCRIFDDPSGSLQLLAWLEFCPADLPAYQNTVAWIHSEHNPCSFHDAEFAVPGHQAYSHPLLASVANDLLGGMPAYSLDVLRRAELDDGIACQSIDERTGKVAAGGAFATGAGYLAYALGTALAAKVPGPEPEPSHRLYEPPPPDIRASMESSRL